MWAVKVEKKGSGRTMKFAFPLQILAASGMRFIQEFYVTKIDRLCFANTPRKISRQSGIDKGEVAYPTPTNESFTVMDYLSNFL